LKKVLTPFSVRTGYDAEREKLARRVHDDLGQPLTALKFIVGRMTGSDGEVRQLTEEARDLINDMQIEVRKLLVNLQPPPDYPNLLAGLGSVTSDHNATSRMKVVLDRNGLKEDAEVPEKITRAALVFVREALANIIEPGVKEVALKAWTSGDELHIRLEDKKNFDPEKIALNCLGLNTAHEAAYLVQGELLAESTKGGARITARFPLAEQQGRSI